VTAENRDIWWLYLNPSLYLFVYLYLRGIWFDPGTGIGIDRNPIEPSMERIAGLPVKCRSLWPPVVVVGGGPALDSWLLALSSWLQCKLFKICSVAILQHSHRIGLDWIGSDGIHLALHSAGAAGWPWEHVIKLL